MFFKENKKDDNLIKIGALLIHAAKIDEDYSREEEEIIKEALLKICNNKKNIDEILTKAKDLEENSNQILGFTKEVKNMDNKMNIEIIETLWQIIYSNKNADMYETSLMRKLGGLLYIDNKTMGDIKEKIKKENSK